LDVGEGTKYCLISFCYILVCWLVVQFLEPTAPWLNGWFTKVLGCSAAVTAPLVVARQRRHRIQVAKSLLPKTLPNNLISGQNVQCPQRLKLHKIFPWFGAVMLYA
jgi:hypothetical protein